MHRFKDLPALLKAVSIELQRVIGPPLRGYVRQVKVSTSRERPSLIRIPILGAVAVEPWELALIESPLLQRLSRTEMFGVVSLVYPAAHASIWEQLISVMHLTTKMADTLQGEEAADTHGRNSISAADRVSLRLAALLKEVGRLPVGPLSERALSSAERPGSFMPLLREQAVEYFDCLVQPSLNQICAALIVIPPEVVDLFRSLRIPLWMGGPDALARRIAQLITGGRISGKPLLSALTSGPLVGETLYTVKAALIHLGTGNQIDVDKIIGLVRGIRG